MNQILLFVLFLITFLALIGIVSRRIAKPGWNAPEGFQGGGPAEPRYEPEPVDETPGIEWEVTEGESMLRQLVDHCKEKPGEASKLIKTWIVGEKNK